MNSPRDPEAELLRAVLSTTAHDLGGLASALSLRADVLERTATTSASTALRRIADELRMLGYDVRAFRSTEGGDTLSPARSGSLQQWLARVQRYGRPLLPRGSTLDGTVPDILLEAATAFALTYVTLGVIQQIAAVCAEQRVAIRIEAQVHAPTETETQTQEQIPTQTELPTTHVRVTIHAHANDEQLLMGDVAGEWWQWALARATASDITMHTENGRVCLRVPLVPPVPPFA